MLLEHPSDGEAEAIESPAKPEETYFSRSEAARYLGVPVSTIYHWARTGRLPCVLTLGGHMRFSQADLDVVNLRRPRQSRWSDPQPPRRDAGPPDADGRPDSRV